MGRLSLDVAIDGGSGPLVIIGPNGSGKTTLLRIIAGAAPSRGQDGEIVVDGECLYSRDERIDVPSEGRNVGYVPQGYGLFPHLDVVDNVAFGLSLGARRVSRAVRRRRAVSLLNDLGCAHVRDRWPRALSGGEQQRVALARALVLEPRLLLLDEPLSALDVRSRRSVRRFLVERLQRFGRPCVVVTHDVRDVAAFGADVCVIEEGRVVQRGDFEALRSSPATAFVAEFCDAGAGG